MSPKKEGTSKPTPEQKDKAITRDDKVNILKLDDGRHSDRHKSDRNKDNRGQTKGSGLLHEEPGDMSASNQHTPRSPSTPSSSKKRARTDDEQPMGGEGGGQNNLAATTAEKTESASPSKRRQTHEALGSKPATAAHTGESKSPVNKIASPVTSRNGPPVTSRNGPHHAALTDVGEQTKEVHEASPAAKSKKKSPQSLSGYNM